MVTGEDIGLSHSQDLYEKRSKMVPRANVKISGQTGCHDHRTFLDL